MSSMLEQAIIDAAALREAALKNAEQSIIEKYAPQIKDAVNSLLEREFSEDYKRDDIVRYEGKFARVTTEADQGMVGISYIGEEKTQLVQEAELQMASEEEMLQEQEGMLGGSMATSAPEANPITAPFAAADTRGGEVEMSMEFEFNPEDFNLDLGDLKRDAADDPESAGEEPIGTDDLMSDIGLEDEEGAEEEPAGDEEELALQEILSMLEEEEVIEEELVVDVAGQHKNGTFETNEATLEYQEEMELAKRESTKYKEQNEALMRKFKRLQEINKKEKEKSKKLSSVINKLTEKLEETLLSNAKLIYSNRTLSDTSLNERQKSKIVEAIAQTKTPDEAKSLCETLKATVGSGKNQGPQSLSESVQRKSNLSGILPRNKKEMNESLSFSDRMKKLAGIS